MALYKFDYYYYYYCYYYYFFFLNFFSSAIIIIIIIFKSLQKWGIYSLITAYAVCLSQIDVHHQYSPPVIFILISSVC